VGWIKAVVGGVGVVVEVGKICWGGGRGCFGVGIGLLLGG
jgi:hypothetical protein